MDAPERTEWIRKRAEQLGFDLCGVTSAEDEPGNSRLAEWLARGHAGEMKYLHDPRRQSLAGAMPGVKSVIVCALNYNTAQPYSTEAAANALGSSANGDDAPRGWISRYAWGDDYHNVLGAKLEALVGAMREQFIGDSSGVRDAQSSAPFEAKWYVDTGPVMERAAAQRAGLGWLAKNTLLINPKLGSWLFLGVILTTLEFAPTAANQMPADLCGQCTLCIDACPTGAITEPYLLDARRCISYLTIELRGAIPEELREPMGRQIFGCDICQDVCPWNRSALVTSEQAFQPRAEFLAPELERIASLGEEEFRNAAKNSPVKRAKWRGLVRNACVALGNAKLAKNSAAHRRVTTLLARLAESTDDLIAQHARDASQRLSG